MSKTRDPLWLRIIGFVAWATVAVQVGFLAIVAAVVVVIVAAIASR